MAELLRELQEKRDRLNIEANINRRERDALNNEGRKWIDERDRYNAEVREYLDNANALKRVREEHNQEVKNYKLERERWSRTAKKLGREVNEHKKNVKGVSLYALERNLSALEFKQMTSVLSIEDEREMTKELSRLQGLIQKAEKELLKDKEYKELYDEFSQAKKELEKYVKLVSESADKAQRAHEEMLKVFAKCDEARAKADDAQDSFLRIKVKADVYHNNYIKVVKEIHDLDSAIINILQKDRMAREVEDVVSVKKAAEDIFERFKKGEKLSTEDLMTLQKSGYI